MTTVIAPEHLDAAPGARWHRVCALADLEPGWGEAALIAGSQVALIRTGTGAVFAVDHEDPATGAFVMARGITGSRGDRPTLASPLHKEVYDLGTGECTDGRGLRLGTYRTRVVAGVIEVLL